MWPMASSPGRHRRGKVWMSSKALIALQRDALRAADLEVEVASRRAEVAALQRGVRARELIEERATEAGVLPSNPWVVSLLEELPQTAAAELHDAAFLALLETRLWNCRLHEVTDAVVPPIKEN
jgi:hypothetical protein